MSDRDSSPAVLRADSPWPERTAACTGLRRRSGRKTGSRSALRRWRLRGRSAMRGTHIPAMRISSRARDIRWGRSARIPRSFRDGTRRRRLTKTLRSDILQILKHSGKCNETSRIREEEPSQRQRLGGPAGPESVELCDEHHLPYYFKFDQFANRDDTIVIYSSTENLTKYVEN